MSRLSILLIAVLCSLVPTACGGKSSPPPTTPLPADKPAEPVAAKPEPTPEPAPAPLGPVELTLPAAQTTVKLVSAGKGKKAPLRYSAKPGDKAQLEIAMDFAAKQTENGQTQDQVVPTIVLMGEAETKSVSPDGTAEVMMSVSSTDARDVAGSLPAEKFKVVLGALSGLTITNTVAANGAAGDVKLRIEKPTELSASALELIRLTLPSMPVLPKEPVGVGAKWQATTSAKLADKLDVKQVTDYEVVSHKGNTWTIKGKTKVTGTDQDVGDGGKISAIKGSGTTEATIEDGSLFPAYKSSIDTEFTATGADKSSMKFALKVGGAVTPKKVAATATAPAAPATPATPAAPKTN